MYCWSKMSARSPVCARNNPVESTDEYLSCGASSMTVNSAMAVASSSFPPHWGGLTSCSLSIAAFNSRHCSPRDADNVCASISIPLHGGLDNKPFSTFKYFPRLKCTSLTTFRARCNNSGAKNRSSCQRRTWPSLQTAVMVNVCIRQGCFINSRISVCLFNNRQRRQSHNTEARLGGLQTVPSTTIQNDMRPPHRGDVALRTTHRFAASTAQRRGCTANHT